MNNSFARTALKTLAACAVAAAVPTAAHAQVGPTGVNQDDWTLSLSGQFLYQTNDFDTTRFGGDVRLGYMVIDNVRVSGILGYQYENIDFDDNGDITTQDLRLKAQGTYHFILPDAAQFVPYVGGGVGLAYKDIDVDDEWGFSVNGALGVEFYPEQMSNVSFFLEYQPEWVWFSDFDDTFSNTVALGISVHW